MRNIKFPIDGHHFVLTIADLKDDFHIRLLDAEKRCMLVAFHRPAAIDGKAGALIFNSERPDGSWCEEIACAMEGDGPLKIHFWPWQMRVLRNGRLLFSINPEKVMGPHVQAKRVRRLETTVPLHDMSLQDQNNFLHLPGLGAEITTEPFRYSFGLLVICPGNKAQIEGRIERFRHMFSTVTILDPEQYSTKTGLDRALNEAVERMDVQHLAICSASAPAKIEDYENAIDQYSDNGAPDRFMPLSGKSNYALDNDWAILLPRRINGELSVTASNGRVIADPRLMALSYWLVPHNWQAKDWINGFRHAKGRLPLIEGSDLQLAPRPVPQVFYAALGHAPEAGLWQPDAFSAARQKHIGNLDQMSLRQLIWVLRDEMRHSCASHFCVYDSANLGAEDLRRWIAQSYVVPVSRLDDGEGRPLGMCMSRDVVRELLSTDFLSKLSANQITLIDETRPDIASNFWCLHQILEANHYSTYVVGTPWLIAGSTPPLKSYANASWLFSREDTLSTLTQLRSREGIAQSGIDVSQFGKLAASAIAIGRHEDLVQLACNAEEAFGPGYVNALCQSLRNLNSQLVFGTVLSMGRTLSWRNYFEELRDVLDLLDEVRHNLTPGEMAQYLEFRIRIQLRDTSHDAFSEVTVDELKSVYKLPETLPPGLLNTLSHYRSIRGRWDQIIALFETLNGRQELRGEIWRYYILARLRLGQLDGLGDLMNEARPNLDLWNVNRLRMQLAAAQGDQGRLQSAVDQLIRSEEDMAPLAAPATVFEHLSGPASALAPDQIGCIIVARNEFVRLKWVVEYYRNLGVDRFYLIDNMSTDETLGFFRDVPDVTILQTDENYRDSRYGVKWHNEVADKYLRGRWALTVDADEVLVFDGSEQPGALKALCARLDKAGSEALYTTMIDMYSAERLDQVTYEAGQSLIETFDRFDGEGYWTDAISACPNRTVSGGVRTRMFWNNRHALDMPHLTMQKAPLVKWQQGFRYLSSTHEMTPCVVGAETGALLHFKFLPDFHARALEEVRRNQHYEGAREYQVYAERLNDPKNRGLAYEGSVRYEGPETLIDLGLITRAE